MGQIGLTSARALEGNTPIGEAHGLPPDLPNSRGHGSIVWELAFVGSEARVCVHKARRPVLDERAHTRPDPWPSLGIITIDPDIYLGSALQLEGEQNFHIPCVGSELHAAPSAPQIFSSPSPLPPVPSPSDTLTRENLSRGEGAATKRRTTDGHRPGHSKSSSTREEDLQEAGGVPSVPGNSPAFPENIDLFGLDGMADNTDMREVEPSGINAHELRG